MHTPTLIFIHFTLQCTPHCMTIVFYRSMTIKCPFLTPPTHTHPPHTPPSHIHTHPHTHSYTHTGAEQYSRYRGYSSSFEWSGSHKDSTVRDRWGRRQTVVVAMDALIFHSRAAQFKPGGCHLIVSMFFYISLPACIHIFI